FALNACDSFVDVDTPASQLPSGTVFEDPGTANAAMADVYAKLRDSGVITGSTLGTSYTLGLYADELTYYGTGVNEEYTNNLIASSGTPAAAWSSGYTQIYGANAIIEGIARSQSLDAALAGRLTGESLFIRALVHFYLVNLYGDIPYVTTTDYEVNRHISRMPAEDVYQHIIDDLNEAIGLMSDDYPTAGRVRANKAVAQALLARVCQYRGDWAEAANMASAVINNPQYVWEPDLQKVFLKESTSAIWQFQPRLDGNNTDEGGVFIFETGPPPAVALTDDLVNSFEPGDLRRQQWIRDISDGVSTWHHAYKYRQNSDAGTSLEYSVVLRLAEQY
ncbi:MAG: RagB/SusD family nutrient uptake outer membrane protein, partial [Sphingobacteriales bacterium]